MQDNHLMGSHAGSGNCSLELLSSWKQQKWTIMSFNVSAQRKIDSVTHSYWSLKIVGPIFLHCNTLQDQKNSHQKDHYSIASYGGHGFNRSIKHSILSKCCKRKSEFLFWQLLWPDAFLPDCSEAAVSTFLNQTICLLKSKLRSKNLHYNRVQMYVPVYLSTSCA